VREALNEWHGACNSLFMLKNFWNTTLRNLWKSKGYSFLNIFGLAIGIACAALIFLWVEDELKFDQFHVNKNRLYMLRENQRYDTYVATFGSTPALMGPAVKAEIPGVANTCRMVGTGANKLITIGDKSVYASGTYADSSFFSMFSFPFAEGNAKTAFNQLNSIVITQAAAIKFFGTDKNVVNKTLRVDNKQDYVVTGVLKDIPATSTLTFEWVSPFAVWYNENESWAQSWGNNCVGTYVELEDGASIAPINKILSTFIQKRRPEAIPVPFLWSLNDWHLRDEFDNGVQTGGGRIEYVHLFTIIAWIILLIACINFMNLATARSDKRAREVGVRKVLGAGKHRLVLQFIGEALFMAILSSMVAVLIIVATLPAFNLLVEKQLSVDLNNPLHLGSLVAITIICGLVTGSYPSFYLSSFNPVTVLKGLKVKTGSAVFIRKGLVVLQFGVSIVLIISTIIIYQQIQHVRNRDLGINMNNLLQVDMNSEMTGNYDVIRQDLLNTGAVQDVAMSNYNTLYSGNNSSGLTWQGKKANSQVLLSFRYVSPGFINTTGMQLLHGRDFVYTDSVESKKLNVMVTRSLEQLMGQGTAVGKTLHWDNDTSGTQLQVVGVVNDYVYGDMYGKPDPVVFFCLNKNDASNLYVRLKQGTNAQQALQQISAVIQKDNPTYPFTYRFVDDQFNQMLSNERLIGKLSNVFASLAIVISCLGLFGLAAYTAERRVKEIGVRKVLGASVSGITMLLSKDFLKLVAVACVVAFPVAWWVMQQWLQGYKYRIAISGWIFVAAGVCAVLIALITVSFQSVKAALANPAKNLRTE
jgi:predicted permease